MVGILIVSHGTLGDAFVKTIQSLVGDLQEIRSVSIWPKDGPKEIREKIQKKITEVNDGDGVVILTDMLGGTSTTLSLPFWEDERVEVVTGVNMPMLLTLSSYCKHRPLKEVGRLAKKSGRRSITLAKKVLGPGRGRSRLRQTRLVRKEGLTPFQSK
jgi:PTS system mannose-specific IIA component